MPVVLVEERNKETVYRHTCACGRVVTLEVRRSGMDPPEDGIECARCFFRKGCIGQLELEF